VKCQCRSDRIGSNQIRSVSSWLYERNARGNARIDAMHTFNGAQIPIHNDNSLHRNHTSNHAFNSCNTVLGRYGWRTSRARGRQTTSSQGANGSERFGSDSLAF
jgi:hypothetical protein